MCHWTSGFNRSSNTLKTSYGTINQKIYIFFKNTYIEIGFYCIFIWFNSIFLSLCNTCIWCSWPQLRLWWGFQECLPISSHLSNSGLLKAQAEVRGIRPSFPKSLVVENESVDNCWQPLHYQTACTWKMRASSSFDASSWTLLSAFFLFTFRCDLGLIPFISDWTI